jgi:hypothetical protein
VCREVGVLYIDGRTVCRGLMYEKPVSRPELPEAVLWGAGNCVKVKKNVRTPRPRLDATSASRAFALRPGLGSALSEKPVWRTRSVIR